MSRKQSSSGQRLQQEYSAFMAYSARDQVQEDTIDRAIRRVNRTNLSLQTWRGLKGCSPRAMSEILDEIGKREILIADITGLSPNVLFALGYGFALRKSVMLCIQGHSSVEKDRDLKELEMFSTFMISSFQNSEDLSDSVRSRYVAGPQEPEVDRYGVSLDAPASPSTGLFLKGVTRHDIGLAALSSFREQFSQTLIDDWTEDGSQPLTWYLRSVVQSSGVAALFVDSKWDRSREINGRFSFVCGMACALRKRVLILGLPDFVPTFDYRDIFKRPSTPDNARHLIADAFQHKIIGTPSPAVSTLSPDPRPKFIAAEEDDSTPVLQGPPVEIASQAEQAVLSRDDRELILLRINLGETIAENEEQELQDYFVETGHFAAAMTARQAIVVGAKGTGKTAMFFRMRDRLSRNAMNLVCDIKPADYMLSAFLTALKLVSGPEGIVSHVTDSAWKLILYAQLLRTVYEELQALPLQSNVRQNASDLTGFVDRNADFVLAPFEKQLEVSAAWLSEAQYDTTSFSSVVHSRFINEAKRVLVPQLLKRGRIVVLLDNLDKAWRVDADLHLQAQMIFSLLGLNRRLKSDLGDRLDIRFVVFLRRNIYEYVFVRDAREPDKLMCDTIELVWDDQDTLLRVIEERFKRAAEATPGWQADPWSTFFTDAVDGVPTKRWIFDHVLPRPRDTINFLWKSVEVAVNRSHERILAEDLKTALESHSAFALNQILAEYKAEEPWIGPVLSSLMGGSTTLSLSHLLTWLSKIPIVQMNNKTPRDVIATLVSVRFLGVLTDDSTVRYASTIQEGVLLADKVRNHPDDEPLSFVVHPAFHLHLALREPKIQEPEQQPTSSGPAGESPTSEGDSSGLAQNEPPSLTTVETRPTGKATGTNHNSAVDVAATNLSSSPDSGKRPTVIRQVLKKVQTILFGPKSQ